ncbi:ATP-binding cassette domain-containing protein, partial [uncultured Desulfovibrio sp.]
MLRIENLNQYYGSSHILRDVELEVAAGSCACLMGRNGVGKTTLLQCVMGVLPARSGHIFLEGKDLLPLPVERRAALGIGYVPQGR